MLVVQAKKKNIKMFSFCLDFLDARCIGLEHQKLFRLISCQKNWWHTPKRHRPLSHLISLRVKSCFYFYLIIKMDTFHTYETEYNGFAHKTNAITLISPFTVFPKMSVFHRGGGWGAVSAKIWAGVTAARGGQASGGWRRQEQQQQKKKLIHL